MYNMSPFCCPSTPSTNVSALYSHGPVISVVTSMHGIKYPSVHAAVSPATITYQVKPENQQIAQSFTFASAQFSSNYFILNFTFNLLIAQESSLFYCV